MLKVKIDVDSIEELEKYIKIVNLFVNSKKDKEFQKFIQTKCLETLNKVANQRIDHKTTNDEYIKEYMSRHKLTEYQEGFVISNNFTIPYILTTKSTKNQDREVGIVRNYEKGFNLALAFEYGTGLVGAENPVQGAWEYNVNKYGDEGWYYKPLNGKSVRTRGYKGFEIYRFTAEEIKKNIYNWVLEYYENKGGISTL